MTRGKSFATGPAEGEIPSPVDLLEQIIPAGITCFEKTLHPATPVSHLRQHAKPTCHPRPSVARGRGPRSPRSHRQPGVGVSCSLRARRASKPGSPSLTLLRLRSAGFAGDDKNGPIRNRFAPALMAGKFPRHDKRSLPLEHRGLASHIHGRCLKDGVTAKGLRAYRRNMGDDIQDRFAAQLVRGAARWPAKGRVRPQWRGSGHAKRRCADDPGKSKGACLWPFRPRAGRP